MPAYAGFIGTQQMLTPQYSSQDRVLLNQLLDRNSVQDLLQKHGVSKEQAQTRIASLTDEEVRVLANKFTNLSAAGDDKSWKDIALWVFLVIAAVIGLLLLAEIDTSEDDYEDYCDRNRC